MFSCEEKSGCHKLYSLKSKGDLAFVQATSHSARATGLQARNPLSKLSLKAIEEAVLVELKCRYETTIVARQARLFAMGVIRQDAYRRVRWRSKVDVRTCSILGVTNSSLESYTLQSVLCTTKEAPGRAVINNVAVTCKRGLV